MLDVERMVAKNTMPQVQDQGGGTNLENHPVIRTLYDHVEVRNMQRTGDSLNWAFIENFLSKPDLHERFIVFISAKVLCIATQVCKNIYKVHLILFHHFDEMCFNHKLLALTRTYLQLVMVNNHTDISVMNIL